MSPDVPSAAILLQAGRPPAQLRLGWLGWSPAVPSQPPGGERADGRQSRPPGTRDGVHLASFRFASGRVCSPKFADLGRIYGSCPTGSPFPRQGKITKQTQIRLPAARPWSRPVKPSQTSFATAPRLPLRCAPRHRSCACSDSLGASDRDTMANTHRLTRQQPSLHNPARAEVTTLKTWEDRDFSLRLLRF